MTPSTPSDALALLRSLGAPAALVRHHELVVEAADELLRGLEVALGSRCGSERVPLGAALHDAGKIVHPEELRVPGHRHEPAGRDLLLGAGVDPELAAFCTSHAGWRELPEDVDVLLVALADHLWKGRRSDELEAAFARWASGAFGLADWDAFLRVDRVFEQVAAGGPDRLRRSTEP